MERLLTGVYLYVAPNDFVEYMKNNNDRTPTLSQSKQKLVNEVSSVLTDEESEILCLVLEIVREQRNNEVHSGYHRRGFSLQVKRLMLEITYFLIRHYADNTIRHPEDGSPLTEHLCVQIEDYKSRPNLRESDEADLPMIRFDPTDSLP